MAIFFNTLFYFFDNLRAQTRSIKNKKRQGSKTLSLVFCNKNQSCSKSYCPLLLSFY